MNLSLALRRHGRVALFALSCGLPLAAPATPVGAAAATAARDIANLGQAQSKAALEGYLATLRKSPDDLDALRSAGILLHQISRTEPERERVEQAERYLKQAAGLAPDDREIAGWLGSVTTMKALFETDPGKQTFWVKLGTRQMDKAIDQAPELPILRLIRGNNSLELPPFLKRTRFAVEDFNRYVALCAAQTCPKELVDDAREKAKRAQKIVEDTK